MKTSLPKSRFAIPAGVALAFYAFLLLGFSSAPRPKTTSRLPEKTPIFKEAAVMEVDLEKSSAADDPASETSELPPTIPDVPAVYENPNSIPMKPEVTMTSAAKTSLKMVPPGRPGIGTSGTTVIYDPNGLDESPRERFRARPDYPFDLRSRGISGEVWVEFVVDVRGNVVSAHVVRATDARFEANTLRAVKNWKFEAGHRHGVPVSFRMVVPVRFTVDAPS